MKTPELIKKGLAACSADECHGQHEGCTYQDQFFCTMRMCGDALAYIQQLESRLAQVERERGAAVYDLNDDADCHYCQRKDLPKQCGRGYCSGCDNTDCPCYDCTPKNNNFIWRGVCAANTEEETK